MVLHETNIYGTTRYYNVSPKTNKIEQIHNRIPKIIHGVINTLAYIGGVSHMIGSVYNENKPWGNVHTYMIWDMQCNYLGSKRLLHKRIDNGWYHYEEDIS